MRRHTLAVIQLILTAALVSCLIVYIIHFHHLTSIIDCTSGHGLALAVPSLTKGNAIDTQHSSSSSCHAEYNRITAMQTPGLTNQDLRRSQAWIGNQYRLSQMINALSLRQRPVVAVVAGGSISLGTYTIAFIYSPLLNFRFGNLLLNIIFELQQLVGHGVTPDSVRYADRFERWMNEIYPFQKLKVDDQQQQHHRVINVAAHGADMCAMAKRLNILYSDLSSQLPGAPDLIVLEFAVNDYQGQDHLITVDSKTSVFFDGFRELVLCAEVVVHALLNKYPTTAIVFLEMQTAIATRKTGALLHIGVAQHYQIPVISYAEALFPTFWELSHALQKMDKTSLTFAKDQYLPLGGVSANISSAVFPYPHGCSPCQPQHIENQFRAGGCKSVCTFMERSNIIHDRKLKCNAKEGHILEGRQECHVPFLAHDAIHPSAVGHAIASDLLVHTLASTQQHICEGNTIVKKDRLPLTTFVADDFDQLEVQADYLVVNDVARIFSRWDKLEPIKGAEIKGFTRYADDNLKQRPGWIATDPLGNSKISFAIELPLGTCYVVYVAILRSYMGMGTFTVAVSDFGNDTRKTISPKKITTKEVDGLWESPISVWSDVKITEDSEPGCTGYCEVTITTNPTVEGRRGNKVKVLTVSARKCSNNSRSNS